MRHKEALVPLLKLHGLVKSIRQLIDSDFETAYDTLFEFQETQRHHLNGSQSILVETSRNRTLSLSKNSENEKLESNLKRYLAMEVG